MSTPSLLNIPYRLKAGTLYSQLPETGAGDFTVTRTTTVANRSTRINSQGFIEIVNDNVPRLDYPLGGAVNGCPALLVEPAATNGIRNNSMVGASAPNNLPTNWSNAGSNLTRQSVATGTLNGIPYVDIRISGTANNAFHDVFWDANNAIAALVGQDWVASCYLQIIAQPNPPVNYLLAMREFNSGGGFLNVFQGTALSISTTSFNRFSFTRALNQATVAFVHPSLFFTLVNGQPYDFTIRIGYPQMERGTVPTSVIPTTTAAVTRSAEAVSKTGVSSLIGQTEGTLYAEVVYSSIASTKTLVAINDGTVDNRIALRIVSTTAISATVVVAGTSYTMTATIPAIPSSGVVKMALGYKANDYALAINGTIYPFTTTRPVPPTTAVYLGNNGFNTDYLNDRIRAAALYPNRLPDTAGAGVLSLATLTTP